MWLEKDGESMKGVRSLSSAIFWWNEHAAAAGGWESAASSGRVFASWSVSLWVQPGLIFKPTFQILVLLLNFVRVPG